ncbi:MAG TPA: DUF1499 domain-containing protein [Myxococcota bacterium]|nr:DUF1499 domain-containing protein [Myxococcota bacterium]
MGACPPSPNCVSTRAEPGDAEHRIATLGFTGDAGLAQQRLKALVLAQPGASLVTEKTGYLYFIFTSKIMRYEDDVEFEVGQNMIHLRSASRVGYGDMGVNRARMEAIAAAWSAGAN